MSESVTAFYKNEIYKYMKLSDYAINAITPFVTGVNKLSVYRRGSDLVNLFNKFGFGMSMIIIMEDYLYYLIKHLDTHLELSM